MLCVALASFGCATDESRARELMKQARTHAEAGDFPQAREVFESVVRDYPETEAAGEARKEIETYDSIADAVQNYPNSRAHDIVIQVGRQLDRYRMRNRRYPRSLDEIAGRLDEPPVDPWGRPLVYQPTSNSRGYTLICLGRDGMPGGEGDAADIIVKNGRFVTGGLR